MSAEHFRQALAEQLADSLQKPLPALTPRKIYSTVSLPGKATAVIGMRRAGKTFFLHQLRFERMQQGIPQHRLPCINFEDERLAGLQANQLNLLIEEYYILFPDLRGHETVTWCLDEIQTVPGWERFIRRLLDSEKVEIFLSGSSAALLSREVATSMRGRGWEVVIHPFSFEEFLRFHNHPVPAPSSRISKTERSVLEHNLLRFLETGGFPEAQTLSAADRHELLLRYVDVAMLRDVVERHRVSHATGLHWLVRHLMANPGGLFSVEKFYAWIKSQGIAISRDTLHALLGYVEDCFLVRWNWLETSAVRRRLVNPRKIYPVDTGLIPVFDRTGRANRGHALETAVFIELERRRYQTAYVKTKEGYEVDFIAHRPGEPSRLIQVAADIDQENINREVRALLAAGAEHPRASLHLITLNPGQVAVPGNIQLHPAWQWFLDPEIEESR